MLLFKKLFFAAPFLLSFTWFIFELKPIFSDIYIIFSLDFGFLLTLVYLSLALLLTTLSYVIFSTLASDWRIIAPAALVASILPIMVFPQTLSFVMTAGFLICFGISLLTLSNKLKTYVNFQPTVLFSPAIKSLATSLILVCGVAFYLQSSTIIKTKGFQLPDSLINTALRFATPQQLPDVQGVSITEENVNQPRQIAQLSPDQINLLKQNPSLLKQYGVTPQTLDSLTNQSNSTKNSSTPDLKPLIQNQVQNFIKPFLGFIAPLLAIIFFFTIQSFFSLEAIFLYPIIWATFRILEKTGFIRFEKEMREIKKLVV